MICGWPIARMPQRWRRDATAAERIAARPKAFKAKGVKQQFLFAMTWNRIASIPIQEDPDEPDCGMSNERYLEIVEEDLLPMLAEVDGAWLFSDGARCHCRPPLSSAENCAFLDDLLEPAGVTAIEFPAKGADLSWWENGIRLVKAYTKTVLLMKCTKDKDFVVNRRAIIDATEDVVASVNASEEQLNKFRGAMVDHPDRLRLCVLSKGAQVK